MKAAGWIQGLPNREAYRVRQIVKDAGSRTENNTLQAPVFKRISYVPGILVQNL